jgi:PAS domain S-box-containing protein
MEPTTSPTPAQLVQRADTSIAGIAGTASTPPLEEEDISLRVFELNADAIVIIDAAGRIVRINQQAETLFGYTRAQLLGQPVERLLPSRFRRKHIQHRARYTSAPQARPMGTTLALVGRRRDGSEFPVAVSLSPIHVRDEILTISTIRDISVQRQLEHQLEHHVQTEGHARQALLAEALEHVPCGVMVVYGTEARLAFANRSMEALLGATWPIAQAFEDFLHASRVRLLAPDGQPLPPEAWAPLRVLRQGNAISHEEAVIHRADETTVPVMVSAVVLDPAILNGLGMEQPQAPHSMLPSSGPAVSVAGMIAYQDISALKATTRLRDEFIALITHELRTPMTVIQGYAQTLGRVRMSDTRVGDEEWMQWQTEAREAIVQATARLVHLTEDLLEISRVQAGDVTLHLEPQDLVALMRRVCARIQATTAHHLLGFSTSEEPLIALVDMPRMELVLTQLLTNAVKFSPEGGEITIALHRDQPTHSAMLVVSDPGIGIPIEQHSQMFERFMRAANAQRQGIPGRGLGLYLARELVKRHDGRLWFESAEGQGSTFTVSLPLVDDEVSEA